jgi:prolyl-tRNA synthetase
MGRKKKEFQVVTIDNPNEQEVITEESNEIYCSLCKKSYNRITKDSIEYFTFKSRDDDKITISFKFEILDDRKNKVGICDSCLKEKKTEIIEKFCRR